MEPPFLRHIVIVLPNGYLPTLSLLIWLWLYGCLTACTFTERIPSSSRTFLMLTSGTLSYTFRKSMKIVWILKSRDFLSSINYVRKKRLHRAESRLLFYTDELIVSSIFHYSTMYSPKGVIHAYWFIIQEIVPASLLTRIGYICLSTFFWHLFPT